MSDNNSFFAEGKFNNGDDLYIGDYESLNDVIDEVKTTKDISSVSYFHTDDNGDTRKLKL